VCLRFAAHAVFAHGPEVAIEQEESRGRTQAVRMSGASLLYNAKYIAVRIPRSCGEGPDAMRHETLSSTGSCR
jgi:hypothetical protein